MKLVPLLLILIPLALACNPHGDDDDFGLWPEIEPFATGYLPVSDIHEIHYELSGNPEGRPVIYLHGGPGGGVTPFCRRFCDPEKFQIVLFDQRGCGRSRPFLELRENTTADLVEDIEKLRRHLLLDDVILFGGSWGTTLALAYAQTYPDNVGGLVLRGVFLGTRAEVEHLYRDGANRFFPDASHDLLESLGFDERALQAEREGWLPGLIHERLQDPSPQVREQTVAAWILYEVLIGELEAATDWLPGYIRTEEGSRRARAIALLEHHYLVNDLFLVEDQLMRNIAAVPEVRTIIVNGRYDMVCPPRAAWRLHRALPGSELHIVEGAGHSMSEPGIIRALTAAFRKFE